MLLTELSLSFSSSESEEEKPMPKKPLKFRNKKEAMEAFKALLKEKVSEGFGSEKTSSPD